MAISSTIEEYSWWNDGLLSNEWGWQDNGAAPQADTYNWYQIGVFTNSTDTKINAQIGPEGTGGTGLSAYYTSTTWVAYYMGTAGGEIFTSMLTSGPSPYSNAVGASGNKESIRNGHL